MMPLAPDRSTMCVPTKPKAAFSIDFLVGNNNNNNNSSSKTTASRSEASGARTPPYARPTPPAARSPETSSSLDAALDEDDIRVRLLGLQAAQTAQAAQAASQAASLPGAGALHGLLLAGHHHHHQQQQQHHHHHSLSSPGSPPLGAPLGLTSPLQAHQQVLGIPREASATASSPSASPSPPHSPPHHHPAAGHLQMSPQSPQQFLLRGLYRPEPMLMPPQMHMLHPHHPHHPHHPQPHPHGHLGGGGVVPKESYPLYPWLLSRHGRIFPHRFPGVAGPDFAGFLLHPFRKPKRIRTAFSPSQLLKLEHAFENNHYVVGAERKQVAQQLGLSETQVKVWFQNRRTKHKRTEQEEEAKKRTPSNNNNNIKLEESISGRGSSDTGSNNNNSSSSSHQQHEDEDRASPYRPVDLSSHDESSGVESES